MDSWKCFDCIQKINCLRSPMYSVDYLIAFSDKYGIKIDSIIPLKSAVTIKGKIVVDCSLYCNEDTLN